MFNDFIKCTVKKERGRWKKLLKKKRTEGKTIEIFVGITFQNTQQHAYQYVKWVDVDAVAVVDTSSQFDARV